MTDQLAARLQQYIPRELLARLDAARASHGMEGERRILTVLFCDVQGSTALAEQLDPEEWAEIMNGGFERLITPVYRYEGTLARLMGDGILAFFGAPIAHEDDPRRAVLAGLEIVREIDPYRQQMRRTYGPDFDFSVRVGINTGLVVVGEIGSDLRVEYTAMGDAVNVAARMEQTAAPGSVQVAASTYRLVGQLFDVEPLGGVDVKGKSQPVEAYRVVALREGVVPTRGIEGLRSPLVGRDAELARMRQSVEGLLAGRGQFVATIGEAGLGKSRLLRETRESVDDGSVLWLEGRSYSYERSSPYAPFQRLLAAYFGRATAEDDAYARIKNRCGRGAPFIASMLGVAVSAEDRPSISFLQPPQLRAGIYQSVEELLATESSVQPVVLVLDDLHWADPSSLGLLEHLSGLIERCALMIVALFRPEHGEPFWELHEATARRLLDRYTTLVLRPLDSVQSRSLVGNLLHVEDLPETVRGLILQKAEGNPFFVEEVIRSLLDARLIVRHNSHWRATAEINAITIPDTLGAVINARLDRLNEAPRHVAQSAAVIGRDFRIDVLSDVHDQPDALDDALFELEDRELILARGESGRPTYAFKHGLTQEAAYGSLLLSRRRELHRRVADCLERVDKERVAELAHHLFQARENMRALPYAVAAGEQAAHAYSTTEAIGWFNRALPLLRELDDTALARRAFEGLGGALEFSGRGVEAESVYRDMHQFAAGMGDIPMRVSALNKLAFLQALRLHKFEEARQTLVQAEELARACGDPRGMVELATIKCAMCLSIGSFSEALTMLGDSVDVAREAKEMRLELATALGHLALTQTYATNFDDAWRAANECRQIAEEIGSLHHMAEVLVFPIPMYVLRQGDGDAALRAAIEGLELAARIGDGMNIAGGSVTVAALRLARGEYEAALQTASGVVDSIAELGDYAPFAVPMALAAAISASRGLGPEAYARTKAKYAGEIQAMEPFLDAFACAEFGFCALADGDVQLAGAWFERGLVHPSGSWLLERPRLLAGMALVQLSNAQVEDARRSLSDARVFATERGMQHMYPLLDQVEARLSAAVGQASVNT